MPVKVEHRGDVPGLVHDTSSTGATVFVEPQQVVEINNQIKVLEGREEDEIERILAELSIARVHVPSGAIEQDYDALTALDFIFARAKLSFDMNACRARACSRTAAACKSASRPPSAARQGQGRAYRHRHRLRLRHPRHHRPEHRRQDGFAQNPRSAQSLMAASGLHIPANEQSEIGLF